MLEVGRARRGVLGTAGSETPGFGRPGSGYQGVAGVGADVLARRAVSRVGQTYVSDFRTNLFTVTR